MKTMKYFMLLLMCVSVSACGPIYGQFMKLSEGLKSYEVTKGNIMELKEVKNLLVVGPFLNAGDEHHMCTPREEGIFPFTSDIIFITNHNDAQRFAEGFQQANLFATQLYLEPYSDRIEKTVKRLKTMNSQEIQKELDLEGLPDMILFGTVKKRDHKVAALRAIIIDVHYELEFYDPDSRQSTVIDVAVFDMYNQDLQTIIQETKGRLAAGT